MTIRRMRQERNVEERVKPNLIVESWREPELEYPTRPGNLVDLWQARDPINIGLSGHAMSKLERIRICLLFGSKRTYYCESVKIGTNLGRLLTSKIGGCVSTPLQYSTL